jgi:ribosomal protein L2
VSKHTYNVGTQTVREVTIDTIGNNSIRIYCMNVNEQQQRFKERLSNTRELIDSKTGNATKLPNKKFPEGTYSHNIEYQVEDVATLDKIYDSVMNAIIKNRGCTLRV